MASQRWTGSEDQISYYLAALDGNESEDGAEEDESEENDEEAQAYRDRDELRRILESESEEAEEDPTLEDESLVADVNPSEESLLIIEDPEIEQEPAVRNGQTQRQVMRRLLWKKQGIRSSEDDLAFLGNLDYGELGSLDTMYSFFSFFLSDVILEKIVQETNLYAIQKDPNSNFSTSITEVRNYIGNAMINSWLAYKKLMSQKPGLSGKLCNLGTFRLEVAQTLCLSGKKNEVIRGRPCSALKQEIQAKRKKGVSQVAPVKDVRLDQVAHWPVFCDKSNRCKMPKSTGFTQTICEKCNVSLCYNKRNHCFREYHNK